MELKTINSLRRMAFLFTICFFFGFLFNTIFDYPLWVDIILVVGITLPINIKVFGRLDVEEI